MSSQRPRPSKIIAFLLALVALLTLSGAQPAASAAEPRLLANVRGVAWYDEDGDGQRLDSEAIAAGARLVLHPDDGLPPFYANSHGAFAFSVPDGTYTLEAWWDDPQAEGWLAGRPSGAYHITNLDLEPGTTRDLQIGVRPMARFPARIDAKIEVVWPHDSQGEPRPVESAPVANVVAYLFHAGTRTSVPCNFYPLVSLVAAVDDRPGEVVAAGTRRIAEVAGRRFPVWEFADVDVSAAQTAGRRVYFWVQVQDGLLADAESFAEPRIWSSVWAHGAAGQAPSPLRVVPVATASPETPAARIDVLWPHDAYGRERSVDQAALANLEVLLLDPARRATSVGPSYDAEARLLKSTSRGGREVIRGRRVLVREGGLVYPKWVFEDVDVREGFDASTQTYFRVALAGREVSTNVWAHGASTLTHLPTPDLPVADGLGCR